MRNKVWAAGIAALLGAVLVLGQPVLARVGGGAGTMQGQRQGAGRLKKLAASLGLTQPQEAQIKPILKDQAQQVRAVRSRASLTPAQKQAQIKGIRQAHGRQIKALLTPDQKTKLAQLRRQRRNA